jgi:hypothetical protein
VGIVGIETAPGSRGDRPRYANAITVPNWSERTASHVLNARVLDETIVPSLVIAAMRPLARP